ncbi:MAG: hypothetical protein LCH56_01500 [Proteobacteria bacterium]|nr:hypothetical protein [Pseudomonadota bacterium]
MFIRRKRGLLSKVVPLLAIAGVAQSLMQRRGRRVGTFRKLIGTAGLAAIAMQKAANPKPRRWH